MSWRELLPPWLVIVAGLTGIVLLCVSTKDVPIVPLRSKVRLDGSARGGQTGGHAGQYAEDNVLSSRAASWGEPASFFVLLPCASQAFELQKDVLLLFTFISLLSDLLA